jgi:hypothetical protein
MASRLKLQEEFEQILKSENVYYNPPASVKMKYPAIVYSRSKIDNNHANNVVYNQKTAYNVTVVDPDPDSEIVKTVSKLPLCRFSRHYVADNLNHDTFILYY